MFIKSLQSRARKQSGDTIVEVIIVLAVIGFALGIAYATSNASLQATRQAEENSHATQLVQAQIESLRSYSGITDSLDPHYIYQLQAFCFDTSQTKVTLASMTNPPLTLVGTSKYSNYTVGSSNCVFDTLYHIVIGYDSASQDTFTVKATWDDVRGDAQDTVTMVYRLHKP